MYAMFVNNAQNQFICFTTHLVNQIDLHQRRLLRVCLTRKKVHICFEVYQTPCLGPPTQPGQPKWIRRASIWREADCLRAATNARLALFYQRTSLSKSKKSVSRPPQPLAATNAWQFFSSSVFSKATNWGKLKQKKPRLDFPTQANTFAIGLTVVGGEASNQYCRSHKSTK